MKLNLSGELIPSDWAEIYRKYGYESGFYCPDDVRKAIQDLDPGEELTLEINSIGGSVFAGNEIYSLLEGCENTTRAIIQSMAASAASYMIMSCNHISIHLPDDSQGQHHGMGQRRRYGTGAADADRYRHCNSGHLLPPLW